VHILALDTSTALAGIALATDERIVAESMFTCNRTLSARLLPEIERLLGLEGLGYGDLDLVAAAIGPGSFTGVRCGVATVQGLSLAMGTPCVGFSTLASLAMNFSLASLPVCTLLDARKSELYAGLYDCSAPIPLPLINDCVMQPKRLLGLIQETTDQAVIFAGEGAVQYRDVISHRMAEQAVFAPFTHTIGHAGNGALLALHAFRNNLAQEPAHLLPVYLRASEAEYAKINRQKSPTPP
jgi:tRNA threonylcarbamoyladenosine biosynthesis protein TsaB